MKYAMIIFAVTASVLLCGYIYLNKAHENLKTEYILSAQNYLNEKYGEKMVVYDASVSDIAATRAYLKNNRDFKFSVIIYKSEGKFDYEDYYIQECLQAEAENIVKKAFSAYNISSVYVSGLKWCNPTSDGNNETFAYLDDLYYKFGRIPKWSEINEHQMIENTEVNINGTLSESAAQDILKEIEYSGCKIENIRINDNSGSVFCGSI